MAFVYISALIFCWLFSGFMTNDEYKSCLALFMDWLGKGLINLWSIAYILYVNNDKNRNISSILYEILD